MSEMLWTSAGLLRALGANLVLLSIMAFLVVGGVGMAVVAYAIYRHYFRGNL